MSIRRILGFSICALALSVVFTPSVRADNWNRKTFVTFNESVEVPGHILPPGNYVFKLADLASDRNVVQIWTGDESQIITTFLTLPTYAPEPYDETVFTFYERPGDQPQAIHAWYYPGNTIGNEFVYSYNRYTETASSTGSYR